MSAVESTQQRPQITSDPAQSMSQSNGFPPSFLAQRQSSSSASPVVDGWDSGLSSAGSSASSCGESLDAASLPPLGPFERSISTCTAEDHFSPIMSRPRTSFADLPSLAPASMGSPIQPSPLRRSPVSFMEYTKSPGRQILLSHYANTLSPLLIFKEEPENPFTKLLLPMAGYSTVVMYAILALSAAHMEHRGAENEEKSLDLHSKAIQGLSQLIADSSRDNRDEVLAVIMLLVYFEVVRGGSSNILNGHLRGALSIMKSRRSANSPAGLFLEKAFRYFDVICALSFGRAPLSGSVAPAASNTVIALQDVSALSAVDNLFGFVTDLWPVVHRLGTLVEAKQQLGMERQRSPERGASAQTEFETTVATLELALYQWIPKLPGSLLPTEIPADDNRLQAILNNAEAYRQSCLVYLFRTVQGYPRGSSKVQAHMKQALQACLRVIVFAGPLSALLWPLFVASCEAFEENDKRTARTVFTHLEQRQGMQNIALAWKVAEDVWQRRELDQELDWRVVTDERGGSIVFG
ncbi:MAG: hypothetical protein M1814_004640 [Vezdaea aestivalis]|nr:MAG: hypothetical protein M1814_004640 [Vezdaea aestivalis]